LYLDITSKEGGPRAREIKFACIETKNKDMMRYRYIIICIICFEGYGI